MGAGRFGGGGRMQSPGISSGLRPTNSVSGSERSGSIQAAKVLSHLNAKAAKGPPLPAGAGTTDKIPRGKATY